MRKIALYCRVSTVRQEKERTIQTQLSKLKEIYKSKEIVKEYLDEGFSGADINRPALNQLREDAKKNLFNVVAFYNFDRLSRKVGHQLVLKKEFNKYGAQIEILGKSLENTAEGKFGEMVLGVVSQLEREKMLQRMKDGKLAKVNAGKIIASYPSYGYDYIKRTIDKDACYRINPKETRVVRLIFKLYLEIQNINKVARRLNKLGIKSRGRRADEPIDFSAGTVKYILKNEVYIGNYYFGRHIAREAKHHNKKNRKCKFTSRILRPKSEWKLVKVPAIIDKETFYKVQQIREQRRKEFIRPTKFFYLCQGLIKCIHCGYRYYGQPHKSYDSSQKITYASYCCRGKRKKDNKRSKDICPSRYMSVPKLDKYVWDYVSSLIQDTSRIKKTISLLQEKRNNEKEFNQNVYDSLMLKKAEIKSKKQKLLDLYSDNFIFKEDLDEKIYTLNSQEKGLDKQILEAEREIQIVKDLNVIEEEIEQICLGYKKKILNTTPELKKSIVRKWVKEINILDNGDIRIKVRLPILESEIKKVKVSQKADKPILNLSEA